MISFIKRRKILIVALIVLAIAVFLGLKARGNNGVETTVVTRGDLIKTVELAGKVIPQDEVDLAFEVSGTVSWVNKKVGDTVYAGEVIASLDQSKIKADLSAAEAELSDSEINRVQNILDAYTTADDAIHNKVDQFFDDGTSRNPEIINSFEGFDLQEQINEQRIDMEDLLTAWKKDISGLTVSTYTQGNLDRASTWLKSVSSFLNLVSTAVNKFETNPDLSQTTIDKYRTDMATARNNINSAASDLVSGTSAKSANVSAAQATLSKTTLHSPISGIVSKQDAKTGEAISANTVIAGVISANYKVEAYVPEVSFAGMIIGNKAEVTLDAYGEDEVFEARVTHIDPRETVRDGVSTYKIELQFEKADSRIRSGMTSNISIETSRESDVLMLPLRSIKNDGGVKKVTIKNADGDLDVEIETGSSDSKGNVEVVRGLSEGDIVLLNPKK